MQSTEIDSGFYISENKLTTVNKVKSFIWQSQKLRVISLYKQASMHAPRFRIPNLSSQASRPAFKDCRDLDARVCLRLVRA